jgi:hypothetical protein
MPLAKVRSSIAAKAMFVFVLQLPNAYLDYATVSQLVLR